MTKYLLGTLAHPVASEALNGAQEFAVKHVRDDATVFDLLLSSVTASCGGHCNNYTVHYH